MTGSAVAALLRIARREVRRSPWRSLLVVVLVMLPVAGTAGGATVLSTVTPSPERLVTARLGAADLLVYPQAEWATDARLRDHLPAGSVIEPLLFTGGRLVLPGMEVDVTARSLDPDGLARGMLSPVAGRWPTGPGEVAVSAQVAKLAGASIGDRIELRERGAVLVVGEVEDELNLQARTVLFDNSLVQGSPHEVIWLVGLPTGADAAAVGAAVAGGAEFQVLTRDQVLLGAGDARPTLLVLGGLALTDAALVAAAAFAVSIRRRQRELGLLAANGAEPRHLAGTVLAEGLLLGGIGAAAGTLLGLVGALALSPWLDELTDQRNPVVVVDITLLGVAFGLGVVASCIAAIAPAWTAARLPVLTALSGRRPTPAPARRTLGAGIVAIAIAIGMTSLGALMRLQSGADISLLLLLGGAVLGTLGFGACSPWLLERLERPAARLRLPARIAVRDTARARSRNGPIVTALLAAFAATVALAGYQASSDAAFLERWSPPLRSDQLLLQGPGSSTAGPDLARELGAIGAAPIPGIGDDDRWVWVAEGDSDDPNSSLATHFVTVGDAALLRALGAEDAIGDLEAGSVVLLPREPASAVLATVHVVGALEGEGIGRVVLPARVAVTGANQGELPGAVISSATAERLGLSAGLLDRYVVRLPRAVSEADQGRAASIAAGYPDTLVTSALPPERAGAQFRLVLLAASLLLALSVTAVAVALGEAESRPDQRSLLALGAEPAVRRRIAAARAGVIALLAGILAVPAGLLPVWGLLVSRGAPLVVPLPEVAVAVAVLPFLAMAGTFLFSRPIPSWGAFREAA